MLYITWKLCLLCPIENCQQFYKRQLKECFEQKISVQTKSECAVSEHFNGLGHALHDMQIMAIEKVFTPGKTILEILESIF